MATTKNTPQAPEREKETYEKIEEFFLEYRNLIIGALTAIIVVIGAYVAYQKLYLGPLEVEAKDKIVSAQHNFAIDSFNLALKGEGLNPGLLKIIDDYGSTPTGNLAHYYAGISYLRTGDFDNAIKHLKKFDSDENVVAAEAMGAIGHAYAEKGQMDDAISWYKKAGERGANEMNSPYFYKLAGDLLVKQGKFRDALKVYETVKSNYPNSTEGKDIDKDIALAQASI